MREMTRSATAERLPTLIKDIRLVTIEGGPHNIGWTHPDEINEARLAFLSQWRQTERRRQRL
jgi:non-heme chloroperoxidase